MSTTLKVGVVGVGGIARTHMPGWAASEDAEVVAGSDVVEPALKEWGAMHGISRLYTDVKDLFADPDIDIIDVCTPNMYHRDLSIGGLEAGKHVICEKPLAPTPDDIRAMMAARDKAGKLLMTAQHFRFSGLSQAMKTEIETGTLGNIYHGRSWMLRRKRVRSQPHVRRKEAQRGRALHRHWGSRPGLDPLAHGQSGARGYHRCVGGSIGPSTRTVCSLETVRSDAGHLGCGGLRCGVCPI